MSSSADTFELRMITVFIDSFVENECLDDAMQLKWARIAKLDGSAR